MATKSVALVDSGSYYKRYFQQILSHVFGPGVRFTLTVGPPPSGRADLVVFSFDGSAKGDHTRVAGRKVLVCGEPNNVSAFRGLSLLIDCKDVPSLRAPGVTFVYLPFYVLSFYERYKNAPRDLIKGPSFDASALLASKTKFCAFLYFNTRPTHRARMFDAVSKYKKVDALGRSKGATAQKVVDRHHYEVGKSTYNDLAVAKYRPYKFVICCENTTGQKGYITEKMISAMLAGCVPLYWGAPDVADHFNPKSFVNVADYKSLPDFVAKVKELDENPQAYIEMLSQPWLHDNALNKYFDLAYLAPTLRRVLAAPLHSQPHPSAAPKAAPKRLVRATSGKLKSMISKKRPR